MRITIFLLCAILSTLLISCNSSGISEEDQETLEAKAKLIEADETFSLDLFKVIHGNDSETQNIFISPISASIALGMTMNGATGETYLEMQNTLGFSDLSNEEINKGYQSLASNLENADKKIEMSISNSVWGRQGYVMTDDFKIKVREYFEAETVSLDFGDPNTVDTINEWVSGKTNDRIKKIVQGISPDDMMFLINAIYFNGDWKYQFEEEFTAEQDFYLEGGGSTLVDMMNQTAEVGFYKDEELEIIELPYGDGAFSAIFIKPASRDLSLNQLIEDRLSSSQLDNWLANLMVGNVNYFVPKLELEYKKQLIPDLQALGMNRLFVEGSAELGNLFDNENSLYVSSVLQKTFLKMDEKGTEAAAVTAVTVTTESIGPSFPTIIFNQPYLLLLKEKNTGAMLFIGKIGDPSAKSG